MKDKPRSILSMFFTLLMAAAMMFLALANTACTAAAAGSPGTGGLSSLKPSLAFDLASGVCVKTDRGAVCYNPFTKAWSLKVAATSRTEALTVVRQDDKSVTLSTASGGTLIYRDGKIALPVDVGK